MAKQVFTLHVQAAFAALTDYACVLTEFNWCFLMSRVSCESYVSQGNVRA